MIDDGDYSRLELQADALVYADITLRRDLYDARLAAGISESELANRMGVMVGKARSMDEQAYEPTLAELRRYAMAVGVVYQHTVARFEPNVAGA